MAAYLVRNNMRVRLPLGTRRGVVAVGPGQTRTLDLYSLDAPRLRGLQQSAAIAVAPAATGSGPAPRPPPPLHFGLARTRAGRPPAAAAGAQSSGGVLDFTDPANSAHLPGL